MAFKRDDLLPEIQKLRPRAIFGINGEVEFGMRLHPDGTHMIFPLGNKLTVLNTKTNRQEFIGGHTNAVSCLDISKSGKYVASGQVNHMGFRGYVILWNFAERREIARHDLHKVRVQSICFTAQDKYVISIGGRDDGAVIVFDIDAQSPICRSNAANSISGNAIQVLGLWNNPAFFVCAGDSHLRMWSIQREQKKLNVHDIILGKHQRRFTRIRIDKNDEYLYLGTMSGDIVKVRLNCCDIYNVTKPNYVSIMVGAYGTFNPRKPFGKDCNRWVNGVRDFCIIDEGPPTILLIGAGDGTIDLVEQRTEIPPDHFKTYPAPTHPLFVSRKRMKVNGAVTSLVEINAIEFYIGTDNNEIYRLNIKSFTMKLLLTCHKKEVYNIVFPKNLSTVFATAGHENIRIWSTSRLQELLRIMVYNFNCAGIVFSHDGTSIVSAWNDGIIRAFTPITGRLIYAIPNAHNKGCAAIAINSTGRLVVTGGIEGQVRVWKIEPYRQSLVAVLKDHSGPISSIDFNSLDTEVISACTDGSCVIWDINRLTRRVAITANTQFMAARFFPTGVQLLTCGTDGRISYWMVYNGSLIRELEGSKKSSVNSISINTTGDYFVSAGSDQVVKLWDYNNGCVVCEGLEHASSVISVAYSPCGKFLVTGSTDGSVIIWDIPEKFWSKAPPLPYGVELLARKGSKTKPEAEPKVVTSNRSLEKKENINGLAANTPKGDVCCVECPPVDAKRKVDVNEECNLLPDIKKC